MGNLDVLIVEDDANLRQVVQFHLEAEGWTVRAAPDGDLALKLVAERRPDIVVLDLMLPGRSGLEICTELRRFSDRPMGVVMVTACGEEAEVVLGLETGADDYVVKPCRPRELIARVKAVARRLAVSSDPPAADDV
ncbi:MAG: response regulator transcription factor, partial [Myxococcales bacterium]|nr:response regulator transcription factor [Myxococcales bacterium]